MLVVMPKDKAGATKVPALKQYADGFPPIKNQPWGRPFTFSLNGQFEIPNTDGDSEHQRQFLFEVYAKFLIVA
jgi:hypothetical protein